MSLDHRLVPDADLFVQAAETLKLIAEPTRLQLLFLLIDAECNVTELVELSGASRTLVSQHLAKLRLGGLVTTRREGRSIYYRVADGHVVRLVTETLNRADHVRSGEPVHG
jgi:DNA-binding transcriptional ArsR family regulator